MNIPYGKVAVYILTFLCYVYSGYGSGLLNNLRDAILTAESVFGDVFRNVINIAQKLGTIHDVFDAAVEEDCIFKCPNGAESRPNRNHVPTTNGCGSLGLNINSEYLPVAEMKKCCDAHDICYDTCRKDKELCDVEFKRCLYRYCDSYDKSIGGSALAKACKGAAKMLFTGTLTLGCKSYLDAQSMACYCGVPSHGRKKSKNYPSQGDREEL